jgi:hypothetical protein
MPRHCHQRCHRSARKKGLGGGIWPSIDEQPGAVLGATVERLGERERLVAVAAQDREYLRLGAGRRMRVDRAALDDAERFRRDGLDIEIVGTGGDGALDPGPQQVLERAKQDRW